MPKRKTARTDRIIQRAGWILGALACLGLALTGCQAHTSSPSKAPHPSTATTPVGDGAVVGGIDGCNAIPLNGGDGLVAGTVTVLTGAVSYMLEPNGGRRVVLPTNQIKHQSVRAGQEFRIDLPPGTYVLAANFGSPGYAPWVSVVVRLGVVEHKDIGDGCV